ncbi:helix-turn-helix domain-containing protein [Magnetospirillum sp. 64-120]|uniref:MerR family transcriptional regulator n=1 Tax=Magnetospirillum sp. 64-120 TaxID=1895778 RepID=UPI000928A369|nr:helix-turn-helix domain-containing protein [Magnetospirillum sp. 64-120]OJX71865.1 MAG: hypothetical protein BGO92_04275 [Magnetospirillum sp. 64-120]
MVKSVDGIGIGRLAQVSGVKAETIRYYERIGLLPRPEPTAAGYRSYGRIAVERLAFIRNGRALGFGIDEIKALLTLAAHPDQPCTDARELARQHLVEVTRKMAELDRLRERLEQIVDCGCTSVAECRVIATLGRPNHE